MKKDYYDLIEKLIDKRVVGSDTYKHNGSTWLIFTEDRKWVIELTGEKTLWYNYNFFSNIFKVLSLDVVENQHYITKWVEQNIINSEKKTIQTFHSIWAKPHEITDAIESGVKHTETTKATYNTLVEYTIENGVKETIQNRRLIDAYGEIHIRTQVLTSQDLKQVRTTQDRIHHAQLFSIQHLT